MRLGKGWHQCPPSELTTISTGCVRKNIVWFNYPLSRDWRLGKVTQPHCWPVRCFLAWFASYGGHLWHFCYVPTVSLSVCFFNWRTVKTTRLTRLRHLRSGNPGQYVHRTVRNVWPHTPRAKLKGTGSAANALIDKAADLHLLRAVNITEVDNDRSCHFLL